jgi:2-succinyl-6-hydroxy-2,4-cyclohexadiene-1-carboxylate synthase
MSLLGLQRDGSGPVLVWLHGFTQTKNSAHEFRSILAGTNEVLCVDLPGHGENAAISASLVDTADLLAEILPDEPFLLGGYSFGGRVALHFALRHRARLSGLVLLSATLGIRDDAERSARRDRDDTLADRIEAVGADAFLDEWLAQPIFATLPADPLERAARSHDAKGLANSLRFAGTGTQAFLAEGARELDVATLVVAGARDQKFLLEASLLEDTLIHATTRTVARAGHAAHLEQPRAFAALLSAFSPSSD